MIYQTHSKKGFYEHHFGLYYKVIESDERFHWPRFFAEDVVTLTAEQLNWLLDGYDVWSAPHRTIQFSHVS